MRVNIDIPEYLLKGHTRVIINLEDEKIVNVTMPLGMEYADLNFNIEKEIIRCKDCISRQEALDLCERFDGGVPHSVLSNYDMLPPATQQPKTGMCKNCRWWKDSDGAFRRGIGAESICPINREEVWKGEGYCFLFEAQPCKAESEDKE